MRFIWDVMKLAALVFTANFLFSNTGFAQQTRTFADKPITVRLCPANCIAVNGHSYKPGGTATILERKNGWARLSAYLDRAKLVPNFGDKITAKPALWVPMSAFETQAASAPKPKVKKPKQAAKPRRVSVIDQLARLRRPPKPSFRPGTQVARVEAPEAEPVQQATVRETQPEPETAEVQQPETQPQPQPAPKPVEVVRSEPIPTQPSAPATSGGSLTWEQVQARLAQQQAAQATAGASAATPEAGESASARRARLEAEARKQEQARVQQQEAQRQAALKAERERLAKQEEEDRARRVAEEAERKRLAEEAAALKAKLAATQAANEKTRKANEARRVAEENRQKAAQEAREAERVRQAEAEAARKAAEEAERKRVAQASADRQKVSGDVGYTPPKEETAAAPAAPAKPEEQQVAVVLPPKAPDEPQPAGEPAKEELPEPVYKAADSKPISFGERPKKLTKALLDKRLRKLPGRKSRVPREIVIAMRHYALGLLQSGECSGIARGGPSTTPNMIYIVCTDEPNYLRQFPIVEQSW